VLLNLAEDHLDWHGSYEAYADAKARIFARQSADDVHIGNAEDIGAAAISREAPCRTWWFRLGEPGEGEVGYVGGRLVARIDGEITIGRLRSTNAGFRADAAAAAAAALSFGVAGGAVAEGIMAAQPLPHRGQVVATKEGVAFVDDSKATNPHATLAGLDGRTDVVLIAGGLSKGVDLSPLAAAAPHLKGIVAIGEAASEIAEIFEGAVPVRKADSMQEAVRTAFELVGDSGTVMLAPACASQDMFMDYKDRGERFTHAAVSLAEGGARG
jgi:UDP-N-acetylmuramoylalanine--D-glutamate ligase